MNMNSEVILLIFSCQKYAHKVAKQKQTWLQSFTTIPYYHVIGDPLLATDFQFDNDVIHIYRKSINYLALPKKEDEEVLSFGSHGCRRGSHRYYQSQHRLQYRNTGHQYRYGD